MGTEVLRPQDFFYPTFRLSPAPAFYRRKTNNNFGYRKPVPRPERSDHKKKTQQTSQPQKSDQPPQLHLPRRSSNAPPPPQPQKLEQQLHLLGRPRRSSSAPPPQQLHLIGLPRRSSSVEELHYNPIRVTILSRGQSFDTFDASRMDGMRRDLNNITRSDMDEDEDDVYAGSAFFASPSPSSLPLPSFFNNTNNNDDDNNLTNKEDFHHSATRDLRRLLRLE